MDGIQTHNVTNRVKDRKLLLNELLFAPYARIQFTQTSGGNSLHLHISEAPASIKIIPDESDSLSITYSSTGNVINYYDTIANPMLAKINTATYDERHAIQSLWINHSKELNSNDSIKHIHLELIKRSLAKILPILQSAPDNYFSFHYFKNQVDFAKSFIKEDPDYFHELLEYTNKTFHAAFLTTEEGKAFLKELQNRITPNITNQNVPEFTFKTIANKEVSKSDLKGRYILLDFWATWCGPCMEQIPAIKEFSDNFSPDKLTIIGISADRDSAAFAQAIKAHNMNWIHTLDRTREMRLTFGVEAIPTILLIDPTGKIVYRKVGGKFDEKELKDIISN